MPSPIGHSLIGYVIYKIGVKGVAKRDRLRLAGLCIFAANAPDLDFVPGILAGDLSKFHHGASHSVGFAVLFGLLGSIFFVKSRGYGFLLFFTLYLSHVLLDSLIQDPSPPYGVPLLWPFSGEYYMASFAFLRRFDYKHALADSIGTVFSFQNVLTMLSEIAAALPLLLLANIWTRRNDARQNASSAETAEREADRQRVGR